LYLRRTIASSTCVSLNSSIALFVNLDKEWKLVYFCFRSSVRRPSSLQARIVVGESSLRVLFLFPVLVVFLSVARSRDGEDGAWDKLVSSRKTLIEKSKVCVYFIS